MIYSSNFAIVDERAIARVYSSEAASFQRVFSPTFVDGFDKAGLQAWY